MTRQLDPHTQLGSVHEELAQMKSFLHGLQYGSHADATELLARLRIGEDIARLTKADKRSSKEYVCCLRVYKPIILISTGKDQS